MEKLKLAVLASGYGSNLQAIIDECNSGNIPADISVVISDVENAYAVQRAKNAGIESIWVNPKEYPSRENYENKVIKILKEKKIALVVLAGYMKLVGKEFIDNFPNRIMNIHPSILPSFPGTHGIRDAFEYGVKVTGVTVHFVDEGCDTGPIILQETVEINGNDTLDTLEEKIHKVEHKLFPKAIKLFAEGKLEVVEQKVEIERGIG